MPTAHVHALVALFPLRFPYVLIDDQGGNVCGCGDDNLTACKVVQAEIEPPDVLP